LIRRWSELVLEFCNDKGIATKKAFKVTGFIKQRKQSQNNRGEKNVYSFALNRFAFLKSQQHCSG
jgi:hypothetical protein